jgi:hypothetical protein
MFDSPRHGGYAHLGIPQIKNEEDPAVPRTSHPVNVPHHRMERLLRSCLRWPRPDQNWLLRSRKRLVALDLRIEWHTKQWYVPAFTVGNDLPDVRPNSIELSVCANSSMFPFFARVGQVEMPDSAAFPADGIVGDTAALSSTVPTLLLACLGDTSARDDAE